MPKEVIYTDRGYPAYGTPDEPEAECVIEVSWSKEASHVQMATKVVRPSDHAPFVHETFLEYLEPLPEDQLHGVLSMMSGMYATLDRDSINNIIRVLRRARDQAFGRDE